MKNGPQGLLDFLSSAGSLLPEETAHIEQWGRDVVLRGMTSRERDLFEEEQLRRANRKAGNGAREPGGQLQADLTNFRARLVARTIVEDGVRTFANHRGEELLGDQPAVVLEKLFVIARRLSGLSAEDVDALTKNSEPAQGDGRSSDSPESPGEQSPS
jgi:hypothetical protein